MRTPFFWLFAALLVISYSPVLFYPAVHHDRYHFFFEETSNCAKQNIQLETFRMGRPLGAAIDCALTTFVESLAAYQITKFLCILLMLAAYGLFARLVARKIEGPTPYLLSFLVFTLPGFQYTVFMPLAHFWVSLILSLLAAQLFLSKEAKWAALLLMAAYLNYPAYTAIFLLVIGIHWMLNPDRSAALPQLRSGVMVYAASTVFYIFLIRGVYRAFEITSGIYSTKFANPFTRLPFLDHVFSFSLNNFWFTENAPRPWLPWLYFTALGIPALALLINQVRRGTRAKALLTSAGIFVFLYLAIMAPILTAKSGVVLHRTTALGLGFLLSLVIVAYHAAFSHRKLRAVTALAAIPLVAAVCFLTFTNLQQSSRNSVREIEILRDQVGAAMDRNIRWIHFKNDFDPLKSYVGAVPSHGDEFRMPSAQNIGNLNKMVRLALPDRKLEISLCHFDRWANVLACVRDALAKNHLVLTQMPTEAADLSAQLGVPYFFLNLTSFVSNGSMPELKAD